MKKKLDILDNKVARKIFLLCLKESLSKKEISNRLYGGWWPNAVLKNISELQKVGYLKFNRTGAGLVRRRVKCYSTQKPFVEFLKSKGVYLSEEEENYIKILIDTKLRPDRKDSIFIQFISLLIEDFIINQLFYSTLLKIDKSYAKILPHLEKSYSIRTIEDLEAIQSVLREKCENHYRNLVDKDYIARYIRWDILFAHLLMPESLQLKVKSDLSKEFFTNVINSVDVIRYVSEKVKTNPS
jgi:hypothetical protein